MGKSGKSTISMAIFNSYVTNYQILYDIYYDPMIKRDLAPYSKAEVRPDFSGHMDFPSNPSGGSVQRASGLRRRGFHSHGATPSSDGLFHGTYQKRMITNPLFSETSIYIFIVGVNPIIIKISYCFVCFFPIYIYIRMFFPCFSFGTYKGF